MRSEWAPRVGGDSSAPTGDVITRGSAPNVVPRFCACARSDVGRVVVRRRRRRRFRVWLRLASLPFSSSEAPRARPLSGARATFSPLQGPRREGDHLGPRGPDRSERREEPRTAPSLSLVFVPRRSRDREPGRELPRPRAAAALSTAGAPSTAEAAGCPTLRDTLPRDKRACRLLGSMPAGHDARRTRTRDSPPTERLCTLDLSWGIAIQQ